MNRLENPESRGRLLVISFTDHSRDPRVSRQIRILQDQFRIVAAGFPPGMQAENVEFIPLRYRKHSTWESATIASALITGCHEFAYWRQFHVRSANELLTDVDFDIVLANDLETLPLAIRLADGRPVVFDAHEFSPLEYEHSLKFRLFRQAHHTHLVKAYLPQVAAAMTVSDGIACAYSELSGVLPSVVWNASDYVDLNPTETIDTIRLVHHGGASRDRQIEKMIEMMSYLDQRFTLDLILVGTDSRYVAELQSMAEDDPRISFPPPVPMRKIPSYLNQYDVGVYILPPVSFNNKYALPNKFFEFIQARLAVAIGPSPEMERIVVHHQLGVVSSEFSPRAVAEKLRSLTQSEIQSFKQNAAGCARELSATTTSEQLRKILDDVAW